MSVRSAYEAELQLRGYSSDPAQLRAVDALERCATEWAGYKEKRSNSLKKLINRLAIPRGVYMHGGVGRAFITQYRYSGKRACIFMSSCAKYTVSCATCRALSTRLMS
jgi:AFG1-like ATPase